MSETYRKNKCFKNRDFKALPMTVRRWKRVFDDDLIVNTCLYRWHDANGIQYTISETSAKTQPNKTAMLKKCYI